jgi:formylglycine-generating enzyme required for sulfatase activity
MNTSANGYRLPTEAEWEYAARGGVYSSGEPWTYTYAGSSNYSAYAWVYENSGTLGSSSADYGVHVVGEKLANSAGLFDMSGNVYEWVFDWHDSLSTGSFSNPVGAASGSSRGLRGGDWDNGASLATVAFRYYFSPTNAAGNVGFRVAGW